MTRIQQIHALWLCALFDSAPHSERWYACWRQIDRLKALYAL